MCKKNYSAAFFRENLPEWKKKKDPIILRYFFRPISFYSASFCANRGIHANTVSLFSSIIAVISCGCFLIDNHCVHVIGALLIAFWMLLDCTDGNLARSVQKQAFGEFVDAMSSYILVGLIGVCMGYSVFIHGGLLFEKGNGLIIVLGALGSSFDSLMRLIYQKYRNNENELISKGYIESMDKENGQGDRLSKIRIFVEEKLGISGVLLFVILICTILEVIDIIVIYLFVYFGMMFIASTILFSYRTIKYKNLKL